MIKTTDTQDATLIDDATVYDGTDDLLLPIHVEFLLSNLPAEQADEMREQLIGKTIADIEKEFATPSAETPEVSPLDQDETIELWEAAMEEVTCIAEMFRTLTDAGMPADMAMHVIDIRVPTITTAPSIQTAGTRVTGVTTPAGVRLGGHFGATVVPPFGTAPPFGNGAR